MDKNNNIILEGIKDATDSINNNAAELIKHATGQLFYLDEILKKMSAGCVVLVNETYSNILLLEFETVLLSKAIKLNRRAITIDGLALEVIKNNCDDILNKTSQIRTIQEEKFKDITGKDFERIYNNEFDIDLGAS